MRILVVEDDRTTRECLVSALEQDGHEVRGAPNGAVASSLIRDSGFAVAVLDVGLPDGSGIDWCRQWRRMGYALPILILTAQADVESRVEGLDAGADDYLGKPFALDELKARLRALARRSREGTTSRQLSRGNLHVDFLRRRATIDGQEVPITRREFEVLERLAGAKGVLVLKDDLLDDLWGDATPENARSLEVIINRLRHKLDRDSGPSIIRTLRGSGYALTETTE